MFAATLWWNVCNCSFQDFQKCLLNTFARDVSGDRWVFIFAADLVNFVDVDDSLLGACDVAIGRLQKFENDVLDVFTNVTRFSKGCGIDDRKRDTQHSRECLGEKRFAGSGGTNYTDV